LTVLLVFLPFGILRAQDPLGMILMVSGDAQVVRGQPAAARLGDLIQEGDVLEVKSGSASFVFCPEARRYVVTAGSRVQFSAGGAVFSGPAPAAAPSGPCSLPKVRLGGESLERVGGLRPRGKPPVAVYLGGTVSSRTPAFAWKLVESADRYRVQVMDESGRRLWETATGEGSVAYAGPPLAPGWYSWTLQAERAGEVLAEQSTGFEIRPRDEPPPRPADSGAGDSGDRLLEAFRLENLGYPAEAAAILRHLLERGAEDPRLRRRMAWLYWKAGLLPAFQEELQRLPQGSEP
jgi:hypothetical protein